MSSGDLYVKIKINPYQYFKRDKYDIYTTNYITISQAVLGGHLQVKTLYGDLNVAIEPGTCDDDLKVFSNYVFYVKL